MSPQQEQQDRIAKRTTRWTPWLAHALWLAIQSICLTLRWRFDTETREDKSWQSQPRIIALWHNRTFVPCYVYRRIKAQPRMCVLTSASKDGALLEGIARHYGMTAIRGSSGRRGATALIEMCRYMKQGGSICITPDGPRGPLYGVHPGIVKLASMSGVPIVPVCIDYHSCWRIGKAWDGFAIPKPFSRATFLWKDPIAVPRDLDDEGIATYCELLARELSEGRPDFSPINDTTSCNASKEKP